MPYGIAALAYWGLVIVIVCVTMLAAVFLVMRVIREIAMTAIARSESKDLPRVLRELAPVIRAIASPVARLAQQVPRQGRLFLGMRVSQHGADGEKSDEETGS